jgi:diguanylate cyclase (GGDEF)-like protein
MMDRIRAHFLESPLLIADTSITVSISFGVSSMEDKTITTPEALLKEADAALYRMKDSRNN